MNRRCALLPFIGLFVAAGAASCGSPDPTDSGDPPSRAVSVDETHWNPEPDPPAGLEVPAASARRLSVSQLERSLEVVGRLPEGSVRLPANLAFTLGQPDFRSVTEPNRDPSPLFMKVMVDLAGFVCSRILEADRARPQSERVLSRFDEPEENLRSIWLRFTGVSGAAADDDIARLAETQQQATGATGQPDAGRLAVCVAAATSPEFLLY